MSVREDDGTLHDRATAQDINDQFAELSLMADAQYNNDTLGQIGADTFISDLRQQMTKLLRGEVLWAQQNAVKLTRLSNGVLEIINQISPDMHLTDLGYSNLRERVGGLKAAMRPWEEGKIVRCFMPPEDMEQVMKSYVRGRNELRWHGIPSTSSSYTTRSMKE